MDILAAIQQRMSVRSYGKRRVASPLLKHLLTFSETADHLTEMPPRVALVSGIDQTRQVLTHLAGSYGLILNSPHLLVGVLPEEGNAARLNLGYVLEQVVLEATKLGLNTCWVTGSYDAQQAMEAVNLASGETVAAVCALGYADERNWGRLHSRVVRRLAGGHRRKPLPEIVFSQRWKNPWSPDDADPILTTVLEHTRLAPSASNRQPWRFIVRVEDIALALTRPSPIDGGIAMAHFALASIALGYAGRWKVRLGDAALAEECNLPEKALAVATFG